MTHPDPTTDLANCLDEGAHLVDVDSTDEHLVLVLAGDVKRRILLDEEATRELFAANVLDRLVESFEPEETEETERTKILA